MTRADSDDIALTDVPSPPKMLRLGSMVKNLLDEVHAMPLDERGRERLFEIHQRALPVSRRPKAKRSSTGGERSSRRFAPTRRS